MSLLRLRLILFVLWVGFWVISSLGVILTPTLRNDNAIGSEQFVGILLQITGIWLPPLSCFAAFWFPKSERRTSSHIAVDAEKMVGALGLTIGYLVVVSALLLSLLLGGKFQMDNQGNLLPGQSLNEQVADIVKYALLVSPLVLAPVSYLTGRTANTKSKK